MKSDYDYVDRFDNKKMPKSTLIISLMAIGLMAIAILMILGFTIELIQHHIG